MGGGASLSSKYMLTEKIYNFQKCTECKLFLSCPPVKVYPTGEITCGRCTKTDSVIKGNTSKYEMLARQIIFPCVNKYECCTELLSFDKVLDHEKDCKGATYSCPICPKLCNNKTSLLNLVDHFSTQHVKFLLSEPIVRLSQDIAIIKSFYLYHTTDYLFLIKICKCHSSILANVYTTLNDPNKASAKMIVQEENSKQIYESTREPCISFQKILSFKKIQHKFTFGKSAEGKTYICKFDFHVNQNIAFFKDQFYN